MEFGEPKMPTPEEMAKIQKERALSDAELIKDGAEYIFDEQGNSTLDVTEKQKDEARKEMNDSSTETEREYRENLLDNRINAVEKTMQKVSDIFNYVREHTDYQEMSKADFRAFENNFISLTSEIDSLAGNFLLHKNKMKVRHEDWNKWQKERK